MIMDEALVVPTWGIQRNNAVEAKFQGMKRTSGRTSGCTTPGSRIGHT